MLESTARPLPYRPRTPSATLPIGGLVHQSSFWQGMTRNCAVTLPNLRNGTSP
jgi:hypothetical protein